MTERLILLQLAFNIVMFVALSVVVWRTRGIGGRRRERAKAPAPAPKLDDLVAEADERELAAEAALRARLAQFKSRATG